jgi:hypothetical protein
MKRNRDVLERLYENVEPDLNGGCWLWLGTIQSGGYGTLKVGQKAWKAHRLSYRIHRGEIPGSDYEHGMCVCHRCDVRACVNPDHLFLGTHAENTADRRAKGRTTTKRGEKNPHSKLTDADVLEIRASTETQEACAGRFGVCQVAISEIRRRRVWTHI